MSNGKVKKLDGDDRSEEYEGYRKRWEGHGEGVADGEGVRGGRVVGRK